MIKTIQGKIEGTRALERHLQEIVKRLGRGAHVRVGFLESATYPATANGKSLHVAQVAFWNQYGTRRSPARPYFTDMIEKKSPRWGVSLGNILRKNEYDAEKALALMGEGIKGQLQHSINEWTTPPNSPRTIARKGFNKPLIDKAVMLRSVDYQVFSGDGGEDERAAA
jgi:hypothetical protein